MTSYTSDIMAAAIAIALGAGLAYIITRPYASEAQQAASTLHASSVHVQQLSSTLHASISHAQQLALHASSSHPQQLASALHAKAWGKPWPQSKGTISKTEIEISGDESGSVDDDDLDDTLADKLKVPSDFHYRYFKEIQGLKRALSADLGKDLEDVLVVREEYETLCRALEEDLKYKRSIVVTGHPGIGKTTFLFYLLLYRLERKLPTAVQFNAQCYFIFDEQGAIVQFFPVRDYDPRLERCWALTDSNDQVLQPCPAFKCLAERVILVSPPKRERWKGWLKQANGYYIILDLPSVPEIAAIAKELLYDPSSTLSLVRKWGPSTRNVIRSMKCAALGLVDPTEEEAETAAIRICSDPMTVLMLLQNEGSSVAFLRRKPRCGVVQDLGKTFIPTPHLLALFEEQRRKMANKDSIQLFCALSSHALTRTAAVWAHEKLIHQRLGTGGADLSIFQGSTEVHMRSSTRLLPGTLAGLKEANPKDSFYWIPSVVNFPGVDGVLGDTDGHVYIIQAIIANTHTSPELGIKKVWEQFRPEVRTSRTWHFVVIADTKQAADSYADKFSKELCHFTLGQARAHVQVWACVLTSLWSL